MIAVLQYVVLLHVALLWHDLASLAQDLQQYHLWHTCMHSLIPAATMGMLHLAHSCMQQFAQICWQTDRPILSVGACSLFRHQKWHRRLTVELKWLLLCLPPIIRSMLITLHTPSRSWCPSLFKSRASSSFVRERERGTSGPGRSSAFAIRCAV